ncbi:hypothetical protein [Pseudomonas sp. PONIH3]|jgi:hypothetical protein|uniref:hypothetical protein n=1 Tax=Pseudomonas sp. PONIH3 TaxID=1636610 RepID=UPI000CDCA39C|nr:hypothetical protein [Pseudomonas sp. PONIH3]AUY35040.1 hypothetical protein C3F42_18280 [Pseudomonas sp. PONIH3]
MTIDIVDSSGRFMGELRLSGAVSVVDIGADAIALTDGDGNLLGTIATRQGYYSSDLVELRGQASPRSRMKPDSVPELAVVGLDPEQRQVLADLVDAERKHATRWWTMLNEMRARRELPDWVRERFVGSAADHDRWLSDCTETNSALFGRRKYIHGEGELEIVETWVGDVLFEVTRRPDPAGRAKSAESVEQLQESVLQHLSGEIALVGTNERKPS